MTGALFFAMRRIDGAFYRFWAGIETILALLFLNPLQRLTLNELVISGDFDLCHYIPQIPGGHWLFRLFPTRHYAVFGEGLGLSPNGYFSPHEYLKLNPDVGDAGVPAYWHWLTKGRRENRRIFDTPLPVKLPEALQFDYQPIEGRPQTTFACHIHVYYEDLWDEIWATLSRNGLDMHYIVTLAYQGQRTLVLRQKILNDCPDAEVIVVENKGRDILPFLWLLNNGAFDGFKAICKIHTKRSVHRADGDRWRRRLIRGIASKKTVPLLEKFLADPDLAIWTADGQTLAAKKWWGHNRSKVEAILSRIGLSVRSETPYFPSGSMYWIKPFPLGLLKSLHLTEVDFEPETGALDGTTAHAVERVVGELARASGQSIIETTELRRNPIREARMKPKYVSAFYLPQYHQIPENDDWWGKGYTEWTAVERAQPMFNHHLIRRPSSEIGQYDLIDGTIQAKQAALAREHGIDAFCAYFYWFGRKRLLEKPLNQLLERKDQDFPFYLCWANESWRRNWDGLSGDVLIEQEYPTGFEAMLAAELAPYMRDHRYQKPDGIRPRLVIYRPEELPNPRVNIAQIRTELSVLGVEGVEIGAVRFHTDFNLRNDLVDFWIEMPPHGFFDPADCLHNADSPDGLVTPFDGIIYDYEKLARRAVDQIVPPNTIVGAMPSWDNSPRRKSSGHIAYGATPAGFRKWLRGIQDQRLGGSYRHEVMINAWNEWGESAVVEPCDCFGDLNLQAIREMVDV